MGWWWWGGGHHQPFFLIYYIYYSPCVGSVLTAALVAKKDIKNHFFGQKWLWFDGGFALRCGCVFLINLELAWSQRFDLVGSLGDILDYLPTKFEGPSWSGLVTVGLWSQICTSAKRRKKWHGSAINGSYRPHPECVYWRTNCSVMPKASLCNIYLPLSVPKCHWMVMPKASSTARNVVRKIENWCRSMGNLFFSDNLCPK